MNEAIWSIAQQCSQTGARVHELALLQLRPYMENFLDANWLSSKLKYYENWALKNSDPLLQRSLLHRPPGFNMLAASIWAARDWGNIYKKEASFGPPGGAKRLISIACSLAVLELRAGKLLDSKARKHLQQRLQNTNWVWGIVHELHAFAYFVRKGAEVQPHFLKEASAEEMTVHWHGVDIPVQCKAKLPGSGRLISQDVFTDLACRIARDIKSAGRRLLVRIGSTGRIREEDVDFLRRQVSSGVGSRMGPALVTNNGRTFAVKSEPLSGQFTVKTIQDYLSCFAFRVGMVIGEPAPNGNAYNAIAVVGIEADLKEKPWNSLLSSLQKGAKQLEASPAGILAIHYADPVRDFEALRHSTAPMKVSLGQLMDRLKHVGAVILSSEPDLQLPGAGDPGQARIYYKKPWPFPPDFLPGE